VTTGLLLDMVEILDPREVRVGRHDLSVRTKLCEVRVWCSEMIRTFRLGIDLPRVKVEPLAPASVGLYRHADICVGRRSEVVLDEGFLCGAPDFQVCAIALHELLHGWESSRAGRRIAANAFYHDDRFRAKARDLGLLVDVRGHTWLAAGETGFTVVLRVIGIEPPGPDSPWVLQTATSSETSAGGPEPPDSWPDARTLLATCQVLASEAGGVVPGKEQ